ncbi:hypothetical protein [Francisella halioticida]|nr:hypothetical protein [Francisella halioticida]
MNTKKHKLNSTYRRIYIVDSMCIWQAENIKYNLEKDLILTYDFELKHYIESIGGKSFFVDHLISDKDMHEYNFVIYDFFKDWHFDEYGKDIFTHKDIPFGFSFRLEFWNDFVTYCRLYICLSILFDIQYSELHLLSTDLLIKDILNDLNLKFIFYVVNSHQVEGFYFPISRWIDSKIRANGFRGKLYSLRKLATYIFGLVMSYIDNLPIYRNRKTVFLQEYHPTKQILNVLRSDKKIRLLLINLSRGSSFFAKLKERTLPIGYATKNHKRVAKELMSKFDSHKFASLVLDGKYDISNKVYEIIKKRVANQLPNSLAILDDCIKYINKNKVSLEILIANIGETATLFDMVCRVRNIPSYLIINGWLGSEHQDEGKYAKYINSYSQSIKKHYFKDMNNIVVLGDPRMDTYSSCKKNKINRIAPTITIGASGFNLIDLNSYIAVEFDFMYDVLSALDQIRKNETKINIIIKVRPNGFRLKYQELVEKYFKDLSIVIEDKTPMLDVLQKTDFYISINSQTLFEASCLGVPVVYYKKDTETFDPPFNNSSELVTVSTVNDLIQVFYDFQNSSERYNDFLNYKVMEKYIGPLDGGNLKRNMDFIYSILENKDND